LLGLGFALVPLAQGRMFFYWDNAQQHFAQTVFLQQGLAHGAIPQWWPGVGLGFPTTAEGQAAHYHPIRLLCAWLFSAPAALMWEVALYFAIAGVSTYLFLREFRLHRWACFMGAASQMFCGFAVIYVRNVALHRSFCLLPLAMWCAERFVRRRSLRSALVAALVVGVQFLAGHPSFAIVTVVATAVYVAMRVLQDAWARRAGLPAVARAIAVQLGLWAFVAALGMAVAAVQVLPTLRHVEQSQRQGGLSFESAAAVLPASPRGLGQLIFPYAFLQGDWLPQAASWGDFNPVPSAGMYCGVLCVLFAPVALWWRRRWPDPAVALAASFLGAIGFALGSAAPFFPLLWSFPGMNGLRFPSRFLLWAAFCLSTLAALGVHRLIAIGRLKVSLIRRLAPIVAVGVCVTALAGALWLRLPDTRGGVAISLGWFATAVVLAIGLAIARRATRTVVLVLLSCLAIGDLWFFRTRGNYARTVPIEEAVRPPDTVRFLKSDREPFRVLSLVDTESGAFTTAELTDYVQADLCTVWDVDSADVFLSLFLKRYYAVRRSVVEEILRRPEAAESLASFLGAMNVKYVTAPIGLTLPGWQRVYDARQTAIWKNPAALPRAFLVGRVVPQQFDLDPEWRRRSDARLADYRRDSADWPSRAVDAQILDHVMASGLDYARVAEVRDGEGLAIGEPGAGAQVRAVAAGVDEMRFAVETTSPALLVISSSAYPGWTATVNGQPVRLFETNWVMWGVAVPAGRSDVVLRYTTPGVRTGLAVSIGALAVLLGLLIRPAPIRRFVPPARPGGSSGGGPASCR
jgi:hypothetical protein